MIDILAISPASFTAVNRAVYRKLMRDGWKIEIVIPDRNIFNGCIKYPSEIDSKDPPIHMMAPTRRHPRLLSYKGLIELLNRLKPRIIFMDIDPASRLAVEVGFWSSHRKSVVVCQSCENLPRQMGTSFAREGVKGIISSICIQTLSFFARPHLKHIFVINSDGLKVFRALGYRDKISQIPLGFDPMLFFPDAEKRTYIRKTLKLDRLTISYFGMIKKTKGVDLLIQALSGLIDYEWQLLIDKFELYADPYMEYVQELIHQTGIFSRVVFFDAEHGDMPYFMNAADIVVLPSISELNSKEQYGRVISEAMGCGRTVIVSDCGHLPDLISDAGLCFKEGDVAELREKLRIAISDSRLRGEMGKKARVHAHANLSTDKQAELMAHVFSRLLCRS